jgi:hypothetical protein
LLLLYGGRILLNIVTFMSQIVVFVFHLEQFPLMEKTFISETKLETANIEVLEKQEEIGTG